MKTIRPLLALLLATLLAAPIRAQDAEPPSLDSLPEDAAPPKAKKTEKSAEKGTERTEETDGEADADATVLLGKALRSLKRRENVVATATVGEAEPKPKDAPGAQPGDQKPGLGGMVIVRQFRTGGQAKPFRGEVEAWRDALGRTVVLSKQELPGFELFRDGNRTIERTTVTSGQRPGLQEIKAELIPLLDTVRLTKRILAGKLKPIRDATTGDVIFKGTLPTGTVDKIVGGGQHPAFAIVGMQPKVLRIEAELRVTKDGELANARIKVVHNDPTRTMMAQGGMRIRIVGGQGGLQPVPDKKGKKNEEFEGKSAIYKLRFASPRAAPSARAKTFRDKMTALAGE